MTKWERLCWTDCWTTSTREERPPNQARKEKDGGEGGRGGLERVFDCLCPCCWRDHAQYFTTHTHAHMHRHTHTGSWFVGQPTGFPVVVARLPPGLDYCLPALITSTLFLLFCLFLVSTSPPTTPLSLSLSSSLFCANCLHLPTLSFPCFIFFPPSFPPPLFLLFTQRGDWTQVRTPHPCSPSSKGTCQPTPTPLTTVGKKKNTHTNSHTLLFLAATGWKNGQGGGTLVTTHYKDSVSAVIKLLQPQ